MSLETLSNENIRLWAELEGLKSRVDGSNKQLEAIQEDNSKLEEALDRHPQPHLPSTALSFEALKNDNEALREELSSLRETASSSLETTAESL